jgi:hypothetical protein
MVSQVKDVMANEKHVTRLKQSVEAWNAWRHKSRDIRPDLRVADLGEAKLMGASLSGAALRQGLLSTHLRAKLDSWPTPPHDKKRIYSPVPPGALHLTHSQKLGTG